MTIRTQLRGFAILAAFVLLLFSANIASGQVLKGSISGTVLDAHDAAVAGADIKAKDTGTGVVFTTTSGTDGSFRLNLLPVGTYDIQIAAKGFKTLDQKGVAVSAGQDFGLGNVHLAVGEASTVVEVTAEAPLIENTQAQVSNTFSGVTLQTFAGIEENEGLDRLALFVPGVTSSRSNNFSNTNGTSFASNGLRGRNNDQEIDGQNNNDNSVGGPGLFVGDPNFVGQYVIVTNNFGPEYGRNSGSVVNIIMKGGTNTWHGAVYGTENNSFLNALTNTQKNTPKPGVIPATPFSGPPRSNDEFGGGAINGPLVKNKVFIAGGFNQEMFSGTSVYTTTSTTPTPAGLAHLASCGVAANPLSILDNFGPYAFGFGNPQPRPTLAGGAFALTNIGTCTGANGVQIGGVTRIVNTPSHAYNWYIKNDWQIGSSDTLTGRYIYNMDNFFNLNDNGAAGWIFNEPALSQAVLLSETHNFSPRMVNEVRVSFSRLGVVFGGGLNPGEPIAGSLASAFTNIAITGSLGMGPATNLPQSRLVNTWQAQDNWNYVLGKHTLKAGVNFTYQRSPNIFLPLINGGYRYSNLNTFLTGGAPNRVQIAQGQPALDFREYDTFLYAGDDWKIGRNLTLNLGLTWTYYGSPSNLFNDLTTQRESSSSTAFWLQSLPLSVRTDPKVPSIYSSFGPSVGFAYSPQWNGFLGALTGHGKTVFRGGYRLSYDPPFYNIFLNISTSAPQTFLQTVTAGLTAGLLPSNPIGPNVRAAMASFILPNTFDPRTQNETIVSPDFGPDKAHAWTFGFERELTKSAVLEVRYAGDHGTNLFQTVDGNPFAGTATSPGLLQKYPQFIPNASAITPCPATTQSGPGAGTDVGRVGCGFGVLRVRNNAAYSNYNSLQTQLRFNNLFGQMFGSVGYTYSKASDNVSEIFATGTAGNTAFAAQNPFNVGAPEYSTSGLSFPNVFTVQLTENLPFFRGQHGWVGHAFGGWSLAGDYIWASGQPYTPIQGLFEALNSDAAAGAGNLYDTAYVSAFLAADAAHPFLGNANAPANSVGVYAFDYCRGALGQVESTSVNNQAVCRSDYIAPNTLISYNALNSAAGIGTGQGTKKCTGPLGTCLPGDLPVTVTSNQVRYIINGAESQSIFGTPFGNVPRNFVRDAPTNILNFSVYKTFKFNERARFEIHATALNALNHFNFTSVQANLEDAGIGTFGNDFANPATSAAAGRTFYVGGRFIF